MPEKSTEVGGNANFQKVSNYKRKTDYNRKTNLTRNPLITTDELNKLIEKNKAIKNKEQIDVLKRVVSKAPDIVEKAIKSFNSGNLTGQMNDNKDIMMLILNHIIRAMIFCEPNYINKLQESKGYKNLSIDHVKLAFTAMKKYISELFPEYQLPEDLIIDTIRKEYPNQWTTIKVTQFNNGFPSKGKVLFFDSDINNLTDKASQLSGDIYTFFTGKIDEEPTSFEIKNHNQVDECLILLLSYFDRVSDLIESDIAT